mmetsp:Transcript_5275/g.11333  ORF Transcript_5275/g.11333 Transcript_5275/m.11333 type:complete len:521 (-) Transcript_5275:621-2183(-)
MRRMRFTNPHRFRLPSVSGFRRRASGGYLLLPCVCPFSFPKRESPHASSGPQATRLPGPLSLRPPYVYRYTGGRSGRYCAAAQRTCCRPRCIHGCGHSGGEPTLTPESSGQASNPYRIPKATPPPKEVKPEQERSHRVMISNPDNKIALDDDFVALQFHEACSDLDIPDFSDQCSAMCVGNGQTGPWLISVSPDAYQVVHSGALKSFKCYTADEAEVTLRVLPCDSYGAPIRTVSKRSEPDTRHSVMKQKADDVKLLLVLNLPRRCLGKSLEAGKLESVREHIETIVKKMTGTKHGLAQGLSKNFKLKKNSLNLFLNPPLNLEDPYRLIRPLLPQLKVFPYEGDGLQPEPVTCFMPPSTAEKLKISPCCFYPPDVCISRQREGRCTVKQDEISSWRSPISRVPAAVSERNERKRARHVAEQQTEAAIDAAKAFRVSSIKKKLCKLFAEGKCDNSECRMPHDRIFAKKHIDCASARSHELIRQGLTPLTCRFTAAGGARPCPYRNHDPTFESTPDTEMSTS